MYDYDACLIYDHRRRTSVDRIARRLTEEAHLAVVHNMWDPNTAGSYLENLRRALNYSATCVVFFDSIYSGPWSLPEIRDELEAYAAARKIRLILVLLPDSKHKPELSAGEIVDYRKDTKDALEALEAAIVGRRQPVIFYTEATNRPEDLQIDTYISGVFFPLLQFEPRPAEMDRIHAFWRDESQSGVLALMGIGGSGKTALLMRFIQELQEMQLRPHLVPQEQNLPRPTGIFVWSFYDNPNIEYFVRGLYEYVAHQQTVDPARDVVYRLIRAIEERLLPGLFIGLDGLEIVQEDPRSPGGFGLLRDSSLRHFVRRIAQGDLGIKMIVTSRYPLPELKPFEGTGYWSIDTNQVDDVTARSFLRKRGVSGTDAEVDQILSAFANHLLTLDHLGRLVRDHFDGDYQRALSLPDVSSMPSDVQTQRLMRILAFYDEHLPTEELAVLRVLCVLRKAISTSLLADFFGAPPTGCPELNAVELRVILSSLQDRGLITFYGLTGESVCTVHPAIRDYFSETLGENKCEVHFQLSHRIFSLTRRAEKPKRFTNPKALDVVEEAIYHAAASSDLYAGGSGKLSILDVHREQALNLRNLFNDAHFSTRHTAIDLYEQLGSYQHFAWRMGDYQRGLRITSLMMKALGRDFLGYRVAPWHDHNLFLLDAGQPALAEQEARLLLQHYHDLAALNLEGEAWIEHNVDPMVMDYGKRLYTLYESALVQTLCDALLAQGKLVEAREVIDDVLKTEREWRPYGNPMESHTGSNPYGRRALALSLMGEVPDALQDFEAADNFAREHTRFQLAGFSFSWFRSSDWYHKPFHASLLGRLGRLDSARRELRQLDYEYMKTYRPLFTAQYDLAASEIAYLSSDQPTSTWHAESALGWAMQSGHQQIYACALIHQARLSLRSNLFKQAGALLEEAENVSRASHFNIQLVDALVVAGHLAVETNDLQRSETVGSEALSISERLKYRWGSGDAAYLLARCAYQQEEYPSAMERATQALDLRKALEDPRVHNTQELIKRLEFHIQ